MFVFPFAILDGLDLLGEDLCESDCEDGKVSRKLHALNYDYKAFLFLLFIRELYLKIRVPFPAVSLGESYWQIN